MKTRLLVMTLAVLSLNAIPATADLQVYVDIDGTKMTVNGTANTAAIRIDPTLLGSRPTVFATLQDRETTAALDTTEITDALGDMLLFDLAFTESAPGIWSATGELYLDDATGYFRIAGSFVSDYVTIHGDDLDIEGSLVPLYAAGAESLLLPGASSYPAWTFQGQVGGGDGGPYDDGVANTITVPGNLGWFIDGNVLVMHHTLPMGIRSFEALFADGERALTTGDIDITVVPVPAAILLGFLGLGAAGLKLRRFV